MEALGGSSVMVEPAPRPAYPQDRARTLGCRLGIRQTRSRPSQVEGCRTGSRPPNPGWEHPLAEEQVMPLVNVKARMRELRRAGEHG